MSDRETCFIRVVSPDDMVGLIELCAEHAAYEGALYDPQGKHEQLYSVLFMDSPRLYAWVVEQQGKLVGYATATQEFSTWDAALFLHLDCLYLRAEIRSLGIGRLLVMEVARLARKLGCVNLQWQTPVWNERAISFYRRLGAESQPKVRFFLARDALETLLE